MLQMTETFFTSSLSKKNEIVRIKYGNLGWLYLTEEEIREGFNTFGLREKFIPFGKFIKKGDVVCDVGAHIGSHTLRMSQLVGEKGKVLAVEPNTRNFGLLCLNVNLNNLRNVRLFKNALSDSSGSARLHKKPGPNSNMYHSLTREWKQEDWEEVETLSLNDFMKLAKMPQISFMKIDVEGAEESIIIPETSIFEDERIKVLYIDHHNGVNYNAIIEHLTTFGYSYEKIQKSFLFYKSS
jgi:FkbM family methyltransferase